MKLREDQIYWMTELELYFLTGQDKIGWSK